MSDKVTIKIPRHLYDNLQNDITNSGFNSVTEYIVFILRELIADKNIEGDELTSKEVRHIKKRLQNLGYL